MKKEVVLKLENVKAYYKMENGCVKAVDDVSFEILEGEVVGIVGESGCGKSTLANVIIMNIVKPLTFLSGKIMMKVNGTEIEISSIDREEAKRKIWGRETVIIPQSAMNALMPTIKIEKFIRDMAKSHGINEEELIKKAKTRFKEVGLDEECLNRYPFELSGGMKQRAVIAIASLLNPQLLIADEPTSALDVVNQKIFLKVLMQLKRQGIIKSIIFITHDIATVRQIATKMIIMYAGKIVEIGPIEDILKNPYHPYTKGLFNSVLTPEPEIRERGIATIPGAPPNLIDPPKGCRFHPRCPHKKSICEKEEPKLIEVGSNRKVACFLYMEGEK